MQSLYLEVLLTPHCRVSARPHGTSPALPVMYWAPNLQSQHTTRKKQEEEKDLLIQLYIQNLKINYSLKGRIRSYPCAKPIAIGQVLPTLTSSLWLMARAECSKALITEAYESENLVYFPTRAMEQCSNSLSDLPYKHNAVNIKISLCCPHHDMKEIAKEDNLSLHDPL